MLVSTFPDKPHYLYLLISILFFSPITISGVACCAHEPEGGDKKHHHHNKEEQSQQTATPAT